MKSLQLPKPHLLVMVGIAGAGKSLFAEKFADTFDAPLVSDSATASRLIENGAGELYTQEILEQIAAMQLGELFKTGRTIVADIDSDARADRIAVGVEARKRGYEVLFIWVQTDLATAKDRSIKPAKQATNRQLSGEQYLRILKRFTPPSAVEHTVVISGKHTYASQAKVVLKKLSAPRAAIAKQQPAPERVAAVRPPGRRNITIR